jgi:hypothetical protein
MRFDPESEEFSFLDLPADYWSLRPEPSKDGRRLVVLGGTFKQVSEVGDLRVVDVKSWSDEGSVALSGLNYTGPWGWFSRLAVGPGKAYVSASLTGEIVRVDLATKEVDRINIGGSPGELDLVGISVDLGRFFWRGESRSVGPKKMSGRIAALVIIQTATKGQKS